jgi:ATP-dependent exoDNAse (exonuclease V) beta subunit
MRDFVLNKLKVFDDQKFIFDPKYHKYTYDGKTFESVTKFIQRFHKPFDQEYWSKRKSEETGQEQTEILEQWKLINERSNFIGTSTHNWIENYFNKIHQDIPNDLEIVERINKFNTIYAKHLYKLEPIKFEQRVFSVDWGLAGTFDALFSWKDKLVILDWKTNKNFTTENKYGEKLLEPFSEYDKCHLNEYSIQISLYSLILEKIGLDVKAGYILYIGPEGEPQLHKCHDFRKKLEEYLENQA